MNTSLLISHEIDAAYWKAWEIFGFKGGAPVFLLVHIPAVFLALAGLLLIVRYEPLGLVFACIMSILGVAVFAFHMIQIFQGSQEFRTPLSLGIFIAAFVTSLGQGVLLLFIFLS
ncbi:MAG: hypothetical protein JW904_11205 [Spirochaetales bacterium]|nr:hypothetical protein [Spirochaetales bacterium]